MVKKQVKVLVDESVAQGFKRACEAAHISMAETLAQYMSAFAKAPTTPKEKDYTTRKLRRRAISTIVMQLGQIKKHEEGYRDRIPENLQGSSVYESAEDFISKLEEAAEILTEI